MGGVFFGIRRDEVRRKVDLIGVMEFEVEVFDGDLTVKDLDIVLLLFAVDVDELFGLVGENNSSN